VSRAPAVTGKVNASTGGARGIGLASVASRFPHPETACVPGAGHWPHVEQPAAAARILTGFIADVEHPYDRGKVMSHKDVFNPATRG
jgi:hypothetical protein